MPKIANKFVPARSWAGYYWTPYKGTDGVLTRNNLVDYDLLSAPVKDALKDKYGSDNPTQTNYSRNHCPLSVPFPHNAKDPSISDPDFSMDCDLRTILDNQYDLFYGGGTSAPYCV